MSKIKIYNNSEWQEVDQLFSTPDLTGGSTGQILTKDNTTTKGYTWDTFTDANITASTSELNIMHGVTSSTANLNNFHNTTATNTELNYLSNITSNVQTSLNNMSTNSWVKKEFTIYAYTSGTVYPGSTTSATAEVDISSYLPNDNYVYEVMIYVVGTGSGATTQIRIATDLQPQTNITGGRDGFSGIGTFLVGTGRKVWLYILNYSVTYFSCYGRGYKKITL